MNHLRPAEPLESLQPYWLDREVRPGARGGMLVQPYFAARRLRHEACRQVYPAPVRRKLFRARAANETHVRNVVRKAALDRHRRLALQLQHKAQRALDIVFVRGRRAPCHEQVGALVTKIQDVQGAAETVQEREDRLHEQLQLGLRAQVWQADKQRGDLPEFGQALLSPQLLREEPA